MIKVKQAIIVEGKYDKNTLSQIVDAVIIDTSGFGIFNDREKLNLLRRLAEKTGIILLTDSDGAGFVIRNYIKGAVGKGQVLQAFIPDIPGKEKRKKSPSKEGKLGVEGMTPEIILESLRRSGATLDDTAAPRKKPWLTKSILFSLGLSGTDGSGERRKKLLKAMDLPEHTSANVMLEVINALYTREEFMAIYADSSITPHGSLT